MQSAVAANLEVDDDLEHAQGTSDDLQAQADDNHVSLETLSSKRLLN